MARPGDFPLTTSSGNQTSVLAVLDEMRIRWAAVEPVRERARTHERFVLGRLSDRAGSLDAAVVARSSLAMPTVTENKLKNILLTWSARLSKDRSTAFAFPSDASEADVAESEIANAVLDHQRQLQDRDSQLAQAAIMAGISGTACLYTTWDYDARAGKERVPLLDALGLPVRGPGGELQFKVQPAEGNPFVELLSVFDWVTDGAPDINKNGKWLLVRRLLDPDEARGALRAAMDEAKANGTQGPYSDDVPVESVQNRQQQGATREATEAWEMWWRPGPFSRFREGFFAVVIGNQVVRCTKFPYEHGKLPIAVWRVMDVGEDVYGATWVESALPLQIALNHALQVLAHRAEIAGQLRGLIDPEIKTSWGDSSDGMIEVSDPEKRQNGVAFSKVPEIPRDMFEMVDRYRQAIADVAGVSDVASAGDAAAGTKNARLVAYATQVDELKNEHTARNRDAALLIVDQQILKLVQQFTTRERLITIIGEDKAPIAFYFDGAAIRGVDVRLEVGPGSERFGAARAKDAEERGAGGFLDPKSAAEMQRTGLSSTTADSQARARVQQLVQQAMNGQPVQADLTINPEIAIAELRTLLTQVAAQGPQATMPIRALLQEFMEHRQEQQMPAAPQPSSGGGASKPSAVQQSNLLPSSGAGR